MVPLSEEVTLTESLCQSDHRVLGHLPDQGRSPLIAQFGRPASSMKSRGGCKLLTFKINGGHCYWGPSMLQKCFGSLHPDLCLDTILSLSSTNNSFDLLAWFLV